MSTKIAEVINRFSRLTEDPSVYLDKSEDFYPEHEKLTKTLYDLSKSQDASLDLGSRKTKFAAQKELCVEGFGTDEIWAQLDLENEPFIETLVKHASRLYAKRYNLSLGLKSEEEEEDRHDERLVEADDAEDTDEEEVSFNSAASDLPSKNASSHKAVKSSVVDDDFFKLADMEAFLEQEDRKFEKEQDGEIIEDDEIDLFQDIPSEEEGDTLFVNSNKVLTDDCEDEETNETFSSGRNAKYEDFFDLPNSTLISEGGHGESSEDEDDAEDMEGEMDSEIDTRDVEDYEMHGATSNPQDFDCSGSDSDGETVEQILGKGADLRSGTEKSKFQLEQEAMKTKIRKLELENISDKPWQLKGEITADKRPENSLLEEHLQFDHTTRPAPLITEETTTKIEDIIKERIKEKLWDDVERKTKPKEEAYEYKRRITLDQEKSKVGLAEVYEQEYLKKQKDGKVEGENEEHKELKQMMKELFIQLDALSSFHFTPKPPEPEVKLINNLPAITAEEVIPAAVSDATLLAPEEVAGKLKGDIKGDTEKDSTDKKRERRHKKKVQKLKSQHMEMKKMKSSLGNKYIQKEKEVKLKEASKKDLKDDNDRELEKLLKSSKGFFAKLQDQADESKIQKKGKRKEVQSVNTSKIKL